MDWRVGHLWNQCDRQQDCARRLVDGLSDGSCTLEPSSGAIRKASAKLKETFDTPELEGQSVLGLVRTRADRAYLEEVLATNLGSGGELPGPASMSCHSCAGDVF